MSRRRKKQESAPGSSDEWLLTFSDVLTLLITFFVLMISMSSMDSQRMIATFGFFKGALGNLEAGQGQRQHIEGPNDLPRPRQAGSSKRDGEDLGLSDRLRQRISGLMQASDLLVARAKEFRDVASLKGTYALDAGAMDLLLGGEPVVLERTPTGAELKIHLGLIFEPRKTDFRPESKELLEEVRALLRGEPVASIEVPLAETGTTSPLYSPWALAGWRAAALVRLIQPTTTGGIAATVDPTANRRHARVVLIEHLPAETDNAAPMNRSKPSEGENGRK